MRTTDQYIDLIAPEHADKPKFVATVVLTADVFARFQAFLATIPSEFDLDVAVGVQLDVVGQWVGRSRRVPTPLSGLYFSFDTPVLGFDKGIWKGPYDTGAGISFLDDDTYRRLLRTKIVANSWDSSTEGAQAILDTYFIDPETFVFVEDDGQCVLNENYFSFDDPPRGFDLGVWSTCSTLANVPTIDMAMTVGVSGKLPSILDLALLGLGLIPVKPEGVAITYAVTSVDNNALFGFDVEGDYISGFDGGAWGISPNMVAELAI